MLPIGGNFPAIVVANLSDKHAAAWFIITSFTSMIAIIDLGTTLVIRKVSEDTFISVKVLPANYIFVYSIIKLFILIFSWENYPHIFEFYSLTNDQDTYLILNYFLLQSVLFIPMRVRKFIKVPAWHIVLD